MKSGECKRRECLLGGSDQGGTFRRLRIMEEALVRGVACRHRLFLRDAHADLVLIALRALFAVALSS